MRALCVVVGLLLVLVPVAHAEQDTPNHLAGAKVLSVETLKKMASLAALKIYDLRKKASFVEGRVPGAVNAASYYDAAAEKLETSFLGSDKNAPIVFYSHGVAGWKSYWAAKAAVEAGYTNVMWFRGGYAEWEGSQLPIER